MEDCQKNVASICCLQTSEIIQALNEDKNLTQTMKDPVDIVVDPKIQWPDQFLLRIC